MEVYSTHQKEGFQAEGQNNTLFNVKLVGLIKLYMGLFSFLSKNKMMFLSFKKDKSEVVSGLLFLFWSAEQKSNFLGDLLNISYI